MRRRLAAGAAGAALAALAAGQVNLPPPGQRPSHAQPGRRYLGSQACAQCHPYQSRSYREAGMANALTPGANSRILLQQEKMELRRGEFVYRVRQSPSGPIFEVGQGQEFIAEPILWAFGTGRVGQTYLIRRGGAYYESRVSYFSEIDGLDLTIGAPAAPPESLESAIGRRLSDEEARECFACHATAAVSDAGLQLEQMTLGISCEGCHGPGERHASRMQSGHSMATEVYALTDWVTEEVFEFCGACHGTEQGVLQAGVEGLANVRFQPYRLSKSRCNLLREPDNAALSCVACHDPHKRPSRDPLFYDARCLACHQGVSSGPGAMTGRSEKLRSGCPVGERRCVQCHMPKTELPGAHYAFTDHYIRVPQEGAPYPN